MPAGAGAPAAAWGGTAAAVRGVVPATPGAVAVVCDAAPVVVRVSTCSSGSGASGRAAAARRTRPRVAAAGCGAAGWAAAGPATAGPAAAGRSVAGCGAGAALSRAGFCALPGWPVGGSGVAVTCDAGIVASLSAPASAARVRRRRAAGSLALCRDASLMSRRSPGVVGALGRGMMVSATERWGCSGTSPEHLGRRDAEPRAGQWPGTVPEGAGDPETGKPAPDGACRHETGEAPVENHGSVRGGGGRIHDTPQPWARVPWS